MGKQIVTHAHIQKGPGQKNRGRRESITTTQSGDFIADLERVSPYLSQRSQSHKEYN